MEEYQNKTLILGRGAPGSGKSFAINNLNLQLIQQERQVVICSSDHFFIESDGVYPFNLRKLDQAHKSCQDKCRKSLQDQVDIVIIDNTNVSCNECAIYVKMGLEYNYNIKFIEPSTPWAFDIDQLEKRNQHNVPREALERMLKRWVPNMTIEKALGIKQSKEDLHEDEKSALVASAGKMM